MFDWGTFKKHLKTGTKRYGRFIFLYIYMTPWKRFLVVFFCADKQYFAEKQLLC